MVRDRRLDTSPRWSFQAILGPEETVSSLKSVAPGVISRVLQHKLLFIETADVVATTYALNLYRQAAR